MDKSTVDIYYRLADGGRVRVMVTVEIKDLLEQAERQERSQKRQSRRRHTEYIDSLTDTTDVCPQEDFADLIYRMDSYKRLYAAIENLSETQRRRICLHYFDGLSYRQIAEVEGISYGTVSSSFKQAKKALKKQLAQ